MGGVERIGDFDAEIDEALISKGRPKMVSRSLALEVSITIKGRP